MAGAEVGQRDAEQRPSPSCPACSHQPEAQTWFRTRRRLSPRADAQHGRGSLLGWLSFCSAFPGHLCLQAPGAAADTCSPGFLRSDLKR